METEIAAGINTLEIVANWFHVTVEDGVKPENQKEKWLFIPLL